MTPPNLNSPSTVLRAIRFVLTLPELVEHMIFVLALPDDVLTASGIERHRIASAYLIALAAVLQSPAATWERDVIVYAIATVQVEADLAIAEIPAFQAAWKLAHAADTP
jgi:hypothetical protein